MTTAAADNEGGKRARQRQQPPAPGIAFSCLLFVVAVVVLSGAPDDFRRSALLLVLYVGACGVAINADPSTPFGSVALYALLPAASFFVAATAITTLGMLAMASVCVSCGGGSIRIADIGKVTAIQAFVGLVSVLGIIAARTHVRP